VLRHLAHLFALAIVMTMIDCSRPIVSSELAGTYVMNHGHAADTLILHPDGQYRRIYVMPGRDPVIDAGKWEAETSAGELSVVLSGFVPRWRVEMDLPGTQMDAIPRGYTFVQAERAGGVIQFVVDPDDVWAYVQRQR
jgi:hypothetical protein